MDKFVPAMTDDDGWVVKANLFAVAGLTVMLAVVPDLESAVMVIVGVSPVSVRVKPVLVIAPFVKVSLPSAGFVGASPPGELVAVHVQATDFDPV